MALQLYDLAGADPAHRFSPYCWRTRLALAHKGLEAELIPWRFTQKDVLAPFGHERVPVLIDGERVIGDSFAIAVHLEAAYPLRPSLFGGPIGLATARFVNSWANNTVMPGLARLVVSDVYPHLHEGDRDYFRTSRERMFGTRLEEITAERESRRRGLPQEHPAHAGHTARAAFSRRRAAGLCRLHRLRLLPVGPLRQ